MTGRAVFWAFAPVVLVLACVGPRSVQGPVQGRVELSDGVEREDVVARLRCGGYGIHGAHSTANKLRIFGSAGPFFFAGAWRGLSPAGCSVEIMHPLYRMQHVQLERRFAIELGAIPMQRWDRLLAAPEGLSVADVYRHLFYLRMYYLAAFPNDVARARLAVYAPALRSLFDRGLRELPPMDRDRFGSAKGSLEALRAFEESVGYVRPPQQEALFAAAAAGEAEGIRGALARGADPDGWNAAHVASIHLAAGAGHTDAVLALLDGGATVDLRQQVLGRTALLLALQKRDVETAEALMERGADVTLAGRGATPLKAAAGHGMLEMLRALMARGAISNAREERHPVEALHAAARAGQLEVVRELLAAGVPIDGGLPGFTALMHAAWKGRLETVELLLAEGADPGAVSVVGKTPLAYARKENRGAVVALLEAIDAPE